MRKDNERLQELTDMIAGLRTEHEETCQRLRQLRAEGNTRTPAYKELSIRKIELRTKLAMFKPYDFSDSTEARKAFYEYPNFWH